MKKISAIVSIIILIFFITKIFSEKNSIIQYKTEKIPQEITTEYLTEETTENFYNNFYKENPYLLEKPINDKIYNILKDKHTAVGFNGSFYEGENKEFYRKKFKKLLFNEMPLFIQKDYFENQENAFEEKIFLKDFGHLKEIYNSQLISNCSFRFFDIDDDKKPELCIENSPYFIYIIKYDAFKNNFILWNAYENIYLSIYGTKEIGRELYDQLGYFIKLDSNGETVCTTWFKYIPYLYYGKEESICYLVSLPVYSNNLNIDKELKAAACYVEDTDIYYFRVSNEQFNELYSLYNLNKANIENITYTYEEFIQ